LRPSITCFVILLSFLSAEAQFNFARRGVMDLRRWDFEKQGYVDLGGEWEFYMSELLTPGQLNREQNAAHDYINFPATWNEISKGQNPGNGFATYHLTVILKSPQHLAIEVPHFYSSYAMWVNNELISVNGKVGISKDMSRPQWLPKTVQYKSKTDTLDIVIQASNFHHAQGGVRENLRLGRPQELLLKRQIAISSTGIVCGGLMIIAFSFITVYFFKQEASAIFFAALCLTWALRQAFSNLYIVTAAYPDFPWELAVRIEYITLFLTMVWAVLFLASTFPEDASNIFKYLFVTSNIIFSLFSIFVAASIYTQFLPVYLSFCLVLLLYILYVLIRAVVYERQGVWFIVSCMMLGVIVFAYDLISYEGFTSYNPVVVNGGYLLMFILMAICLAIQYGFIKRAPGQRDVLTYDDLYGSRK
jgi:hypothetical protein